MGLELVAWVMDVMVTVMGQNEVMVCSWVVSWMKCGVIRIPDFGSFFGGLIVCSCVPRFFVPGSLKSIL